jgi:hypothetical protein
MCRVHFDLPCVHIRSQFARSLSLIFSDYMDHSTWQLRRVADNISCIPEFLGYETYLMFKPKEEEHAEEIIDFLLPFHMGTLFIDKVVDGDFAPSQELYLAIDLIRRCEKKLFTVSSNSHSLYTYNYYTRMASTLQRVSFERATLRQNCSLSAYRRVVEDLSSSYAMCTLVPAMIAEVRDRSILAFLEGYARHLYVVFHILDDIRDVEEDKIAHRPNYVVLCGSRKGALERCYGNLTKASNYIESVNIRNFHKEYLKWLTVFFEGVVEKESG